MLGPYACMRVVVLSETSIECVMPDLDGEQAESLAVVVQQSGG